MFLEKVLGINRIILNLNCIKTLSDRYKLPVGYSGHETSTAPSIFAAVLGAPVIERHVTLDRAMYGSDQSASLETISREFSPFTITSTSPSSST